MLCMIVMIPFVTLFYIFLTLLIIISIFICLIVLRNTRLTYPKIYFMNPFNNTLDYLCTSKTSLKNQQLMAMFIPFHILTLIRKIV